jgi:arylsulfatase A-like enzyme/tetratricopeptide (TPR) repeat protein
MTLVVMKKSLITAIVIAAGVILAVFGLVGRRPKPVNVLLISLDTLRPDHLGCYGYKDILTPTIDNLAGEGVLFEDALTSVPLTLPSHTSMLTGLYPISHGVRDNGTFILRDQFTTLAEVLKAREYATGAFVGSFILDSRYGLAQGFDIYNDEMGSDTGVSAFAPAERPAEAVRRPACEWLERTLEPFLAFVHYYDPHIPYEPPAPYDSLYPGRPYDGEIAYSDREVGEVLDVLKQRGILDRTLVVLVSDHGEGLGAHDEIAHGILMYDTTMKVVLIVRPPREHEVSRAITASRRVNQVAELVDIMPTILDLLGIDVDIEFDGRSIVPLLVGRSLPPKNCYMETLYPYFSHRWSPLRGLRFNKWKYILAPEPEIYNVDKDPMESTNLYATETERAEQLRENLEVIAARESSGPSVEINLSVEERRKLQALGYVSASRPTIPRELTVEGTDPKHMIGSLQDLMGSGMDAFDAGDFATARRDFGRMADLDPGNPQAHLYLGRTLMEMGDLARAEVEFNRIVEIDSAHSQAFFHLGNIAHQQGDLDQALILYRIAARILPETPETISNIGSILMEKGMIDSAMAVLEQALRIDPNDQIALVNIGLGHLSLEDYDQALKWFHRTLSVNPNHIKALMNIAFIYIKRGDTDSTVAYLERAADVAPNDVTILQNLGNAYRQVGMVAEAAEVFEAAVAIEPDNVMALFGLAATKAQQGSRQESVALLERILRLDPDFTPARQALQTLTSGS